MSDNSTQRQLVARGKKRETNISRLEWNVDILWRTKTEQFLNYEAGKGNIEQALVG